MTGLTTDSSALLAGQPGQRRAGGRPWGSRVAPAPGDAGASTEPVTAAGGACGAACPAAGPLLPASSHRMEASASPPQAALGLLLAHADVAKAGDEDGRQRDAAGVLECGVIPGARVLAAVELRRSLPEPWGATRPGSAAHAARRPLRLPLLSRSDPNMQLAGLLF